MSSTITLRRAAKLRNRLTERLAQISAELRNTAVNVNLYDLDITTKLAGKAEDYNELIVRFFAVSRALYSVRHRIDVANAAQGVNSRLAEQVALLGQLRAMKTVADIKEARPSEALIAARITGQLERLKVSEYAQDHMAFTFITEEMIESAKDQVVNLQTRLDVLQEELEAINSGQKIIMEDAELAVLQQERIV